MDDIGQHAQPAEGEMSETMQIRVSRPSRAERTTTSCGECRRRKQKCNQGQPCSNCARRYPQPVCEYKSHPKRTSPITSSLNAFSVPILPAPFGSDDDGFQFNGIQQPFFPIQHGSPVHSPWAAASDSPYGYFGPVVRWSGVDIMTQFPGSAQAPWNAPWTGAIGSLGPAGLPICDANCTLHSDAVHDAVKLLQATHSAPLRFLNTIGNADKSEEVAAWLMSLNTHSPTTSSSSLWPLSASTHDMMYLPIPPTKENAELLRIFVKLISRFKAALDGEPGDSHPYIKYFVPFCIQTPLLAQISIYTSACFLNETGHIDKTVAMAHKGQAIRMLNEHLRSSKSTSDEAIVGVLQLILDEWYWGETRDLQAHLRGLREMIRLRGGFRNLGMHGLLSKLAIMSDAVIALSFESSTFLGSDDPDAEPQEPQQAPFRVSHNTPLIPQGVPFSNCVEALDIHPATASILDDMRFLISTVLALPANPSKNELQKLQSTSAWIYERISGLPEHSPEVKRRPSASPVDPVLAADQFALAALKLEAPSANLTVPPRSSRRSLSPRSPRSPHAPLSPRLDSSAEHSGGSGGDEPASSSPRSFAARRSPSIHSHRSASSRRPSPVPVAVEDTTAASDEPLPAPDYLYQSVRQAALLYSQAVMMRQPFSSVVSQAAFHRLWATMWHVPLAKWKALVGVFHWALMSVVPTARGTPPDRFVKSMVNISVVQMGLDNWDMTAAAMRAALRFQRWLRDGRAREDSEAATERTATTAATTATTAEESVLSARGRQRGESSASSGADEGESAGPRLDKGKGREVVGLEGGVAGAAAAADQDEMDVELPLHPSRW